MQSYRSAIRMTRSSIASLGFLVPIATLSLSAIAEDTSSVQGNNRADTTTRSIHANEPNPESYYSFGAIQLYGNASELWLFLDVERQINRSRYAEPATLSEFKVFRAFKIKASGEIKKWTSTNPEFTAHRNSSYFIRQGGETHIVLLDRRQCYRLVESDSGMGKFKVVPETPQWKELATRDERDFLQMLSNSNKLHRFVRIGQGYYGFGDFPPQNEDYISKELKVRIRFEEARDGIGWVKVAVIFSNTAKMKEKVLIDLTTEAVE
jgi:hypothetical protein